MATRPPKALLERAVKAAQLYCGSADKMDIRQAQKLYTRMDRAIDAVATKSGVDRQNAHDQIVAEAKRRGCLNALPGKDY